MNSNHNATSETRKKGQLGLVTITPLGLAQCNEARLMQKSESTTPGTGQREQRRKQNLRDAMPAGALKERRQIFEENGPDPLSQTAEPHHTMKRVSTSKPSAERNAPAS